jgi:hypothetical protein
VTVGMGSWQDGRWIGGGWPHSSPPRPAAAPSVPVFPRGTALAYRMGCRSDVCRAWKAVENRAYRARKAAA